MKRTLLAWSIFFGGLSIEMGVDHVLRIQDGNIRTGGIPELLWFLIQIGLGAVALWIVFAATKPLVTVWRRLIAFGIQAGIGFLAYAFLGLYYVTGTGIDSL